MEHDTYSLNLFREEEKDLFGENGAYKNINHVGPMNRMRNLINQLEKEIEKSKSKSILKDLMELKRYSTGFDNVGSVLNENGAWIKRSDVEAIINKYLNP